MSKTVSANSPKSKISVGTAEAKPTYGLSFLEDGGCRWQFVIDEMSEHAATITTFSWIDGTDYSVEHVTRDFLRDRCILFASHDAFLSQANYWGDAFADRRHPRFVEAGA